MMGEHVMMRQLATADREFTAWAEVTDAGMLNVGEAQGVVEGIVGAVLGLGTQVAYSAAGRAIRLRLTVEDPQQSVWQADETICEILVADDFVAHSVVEAWREWLVDQAPMRGAFHRLSPGALAVARRVLGENDS